MQQRLSPPIINSKIAAFTGTKLIVPFSLSKSVAPVDFHKVSLILKTVQTNIEKVNMETTTYQYNYETKQYEAHFNLQGIFTPIVGQYYKVQIALVSAATAQAGYYSTVGVVKYTSEPKVQIKELLNGQKQHMYEYTGMYSQEGDTSEKVYSYCFNLYDETNKIVLSSGELIHDNSKDTSSSNSTDTWNVRKTLDANISYELEYIITTVNGLKKSSGRYQIIESEIKPPNIHADLIAENNFEDGYIAVKLKGDKSNILVTGRFILMRCSSEDNFQSWYELTRFNLSQWSSNTTKVICKDYIVKQGIEYIYAIRAYNSLGLYSDRVKNINGPVKCDFEDAFLYDGERQLKIRFNPKITNFKSTILEQKKDTIGGKFPFIFRNGNVAYKEFSISGLISLNADENNEFLSGLTIGDEETFKHCLTADNMRKEREFKLMVLDWLTNGKPKLFRSPAEGNYIVRLMNTSLAPNDTLGRMLHTFTTSACEVAEYNFENLKQFDFAVSDYTETRSLRMNQIDLLNPPKELLENIRNTKKLVLPAAVFVSVSAEPYTKFSYTLQNGTVNTASIGNTGVLELPSDVLVSTPVIGIELVSESWGREASLTYGYYDSVTDSFSIISNVTMKDEVIQIPGRGMDKKNNIISELEDLHQKTGAFYFIRVQPRDVIKVFYQNGRLYYNNNGNEVSTLNPNIIYHMFNSFDSGSDSGYYIDGSIRSLNGVRIDDVKKPLDEINYHFHITGMRDGEYVDFSENNSTTGRYDALTRFSSIDELYAGDGLILDIVYQKKEIQYVVEDINNIHYDYKTGQAKSAWESDLRRYNDLVSQNADAALIASWAEKVQNSYEIYLYWLDQAIKEIEEEYGVEYAL